MQDYFKRLFISILLACLSMPVLESAQADQDGTDASGSTDPNAAGQGAQPAQSASSGGLAPPPPLAPPPSLGPTPDSGTSTLFSTLGAVATSISHDNADVQKNNTNANAQVQGLAIQGQTQNTGLQIAANSKDREQAAQIQGQTTQARDMEHMQLASQGMSA